MRTSSTRREAIKTALKAGAYATPVVFAATVPKAVAAVTSPPSMGADLVISLTRKTFENNTGEFLVLAANLGPAPASAVVVTITHSATLTLTSYGVTQGAIDPTTGIWSVGTLPVNIGTVPPIRQPLLTFFYAGTGNITATMTSSTPDPNPANNTDSI